MIPSAPAVEKGAAVIAGQMGLPTRVSGPAVRNALSEADQLCADVYDAPAALLYAFGRTPRCFAAFRAMSVLVVSWHAHTLGFKLEVSFAELGEVLLRVALGELEYDDVRSWLGGRLLPYGG